MKTFDFGDTGGLFDDFEVNREPFWPRIWWLVAGSGAWHLVLIVMIVMIPPVRDAFSLAALFSGPGFVDKSYKRTTIGDDAEIIEFTTEKFHYPEGYFLMDQQALPTPGQYPVAAPFRPRSFMQPTPSPLPSPTAAPAGSATPGIAANGNKAGDGKPSPSVDKETEKAQKDLEEASKKTGIELPQEGEINKAPFKDLAAYATQLRDGGKLDFDKPFEVSIDTSLDKDGKLVNPQVTRKSGDDNLIELAKHLVAAMNDSGILVYLKKINEDKPGTRVVFTIKQDNNEVTAIVETEVSTPDSASKLSRAFALMLAIGAESRKGKDEEPLLRKTLVEADTNKVRFKLALPHQDVVDIVKKGTAAASPTVKPGT